jgi:hypothetical protein
MILSVSLSALLDFVSVCLSGGLTCPHGTIPLPAQAGSAEVLPAQVKQNIWASCFGSRRGDSGGFGSFRLAGEHHISVFDVVCRSPWYNLCAYSVRREGSSFACRR